MVRCSNTVSGIVNIFVFIVSIFMLISGIYVSLHGSSQCDRLLNKPVIALGALLMVISIAGIVGSFCGVTWLLWVYLILMSLIIVISLCFTIFAFAVTNKGSGESIPGKAYKEYRLEAYSTWLQKRVNNRKHWKSIRSCIIEDEVCKSFEKDFGREPVSAFNKTDFFPLASGCCKPSNDCNFTYISPTNWNKTTGSNKNSDCQLWDNDSKKLCYNCKACKAGFLDSLQASWRVFAFVHIFLIILLIIFNAIGCCALRNNNTAYAYSRTNAM